MNGIQLELTCKASKLVRADINSKNFQTKKIEIENASNIREVHLKVDVRQGQQVFKGLRFLDENKQKIVNVEWDDTYQGAWIKRKIPTGCEIIGGKCHIGK